MPAPLRPFVVFIALLTFCAPHGAAARADEPRILLFTRTTGFRHDSIIAGAEAIVKLGDRAAFTIDPTDDPADFTDANLKRYRAIIFLNTTGNILNDVQQAAMERFIRAGGGWVGIHAAADTEYDWKWFGGLVGAYFKSHPAVQPGAILVTDRAHPATAHLPPRWVRTDEWYDYTTNPRGRVHILMSLDESSYSGAAMDGGALDHPIAWCHEYDGGRAFYTGLGHTAETFTEPLFLDHLKGGILWAAGLLPGDASGTIESCYEKVILDDHVSDPMELTVLPDGRVLFVERGGVFKLWKPDTRSTVAAGFVDVSTELEDGLLGVTHDPDFSRNGWIYAFYSPFGREPIQRVSRFTLRGDTLDPASERVLLTIPTQRKECCHSGGSLAFGPDGNLYISTGDNVNPFASDGYAPIDARPGREPWDARGSSANPNDLRGKILRIKPLADGTYAIPDGNLFPRDAAGNSEGRPEIYVMGCRNPFRISIDPRGTLYWGDVGPDASEPKDGRGPAGHDEFNRTRTPGNFGWPLFIADNKPYHDHDFASATSGAAFDPAAPINSSPNNTGAHAIPLAQPAWIYYPYGASKEFPWVGEGGRTAMAGPTYIHKPMTGSPFRLPASFDGALFIYEWTRNWIKVVRFDDRGEILHVEPFMSTATFTRPMDLELGPDGCLYGIEWGTGFGGGNPDATIFRIEHYRDGIRPPLARATASQTNGKLPLRIEFSAAGSKSRNAGSGIDLAWDFDGDGTIDSRDEQAEFTYTTPGEFAARLTATDHRRGIASTTILNIPIVAGNTAPLIRFDSPPHGGVADIGERVEYRVHIEDAEDGPFDAARDSDRLTVQPLLGHDTHAHPARQLHTATGIIQLEREEIDGDHPEVQAEVSGGSGGASGTGGGGAGGGGSHGEGANLFTVISATYTDRPPAKAPGTRALTSRAEVILQPRRKQAEHYTAHSGIVQEKCEDEGGGVACAYIENGDWVSYAPVNLLNIDAMKFRVSSAAKGGTIEVRLGATASDSTLVASIPVAPTGGWQKWETVEAPLDDAARGMGTHTLFLVFKGEGKSSLFNLNWIEFVGKGVGQEER
jgi:glucose/arabinose dehydrogenase/type 1 glutamine amidotransferase/PKD repeat protein